MEEKNAEDNNSSGNDSPSFGQQINQDERKKNITSQQNRDINNIPNNETENHKDNINSSSKGNVEEKKEQKVQINSNQTTGFNQSSEVIGKDTILKRYHRLSQEKHAKGSKRYFDNVFTIIVIAYTILILILGFFVYRDISKRLKSLESRISDIERSVLKNKNISFEDLEIYDLD